MASLPRFHLTGGAANAVPSISLGGVGSSVVLSSVALNNLFSRVEPEQATAGDTRYRAIDIVNTGDAASKDTAFFLVDSTSPDTAISAALDTTTQTITTDDTAPTGVTFSQPTRENPLTVPDLAVGARQRVWIRRVVSAGAVNMADDTMQLAVIFA